MEGEHSYWEFARLRDIEEPMNIDIELLIHSNLEESAVFKPLFVFLSLFLLSLFLLWTIFCLVGLYLLLVIYVTVIMIIYICQIIKALLQSLDSRRMENHFIHPANYHCGCEIFNKSVAAFFSKVNGYYYPKYEYLVVYYQENAEEDIYNCLI